MMTSSQARSGGWLTIDLGAIAANYTRLRALVGNGVRTAAAVKADCYGLGAERIAPVLQAAGCRNFFVATIEEGIALRRFVSRDCAIFVLNGAMPGTETELRHAGLHPVLNCREQIDAWQALARKEGSPLPAVVQIDSGMSRFGLGATDLLEMHEQGDGLAGIVPILVMSHLACADEPAHPANRAQREAFMRLRAQLPPTLYSLAASSGIFLGTEWHFDLVRPGAALYGINPTPGAANPMRPVVRLQSRVVQTRTIGSGTAVGYGARFIANRPSRIATLATGYADGVLRATGGRGQAVLPGYEGIRLPIIGRISMDCLALDVTDLGDVALPAGTPIDLIGANISLEEVAIAADTIGYEILTALGSRYDRTYIASDFSEG